MKATIFSTIFVLWMWSFLVLSCLTMEIVVGAGASSASTPQPSPPPPPPQSNVQHQINNNNDSNKTPSVEINFSGRIKCLLWGSNPTLQQQGEVGSLIPLPSVIPHRHHHHRRRSAPTTASSSSNSEGMSSSFDNSIPSKPLVPLFGGIHRNERRQNTQMTKSSSPTTSQPTSSWLSSVRPHGIFATIDYKFSQQQKNPGPQSSSSSSSSSSYGLDRVGTILCWRRRRRKRPRQSIHTDRINVLQRFFPSSMDVSLERSLPLGDPSSSLLPIEPPIIDVAGLHFGWNHHQQQHQDDDEDSEEEQFSTNPRGRTPVLHIQLDGSDQSSTVGDTQRSLLSSGVFMPFGRRFDLQLISHWKFGKKEGDHVQGRGYHQRHESDENNYNIKNHNNDRNNNPDWWLPHITLDPLGSLTSENRFTAFVGNDDSTSTRGSKRDLDGLAVAGGYSTPPPQQQQLQQSCNPRYMMDLKLRIRTQVSVLAFAAPNIASGMGIGSSAVAGEDDHDEDEVAASLRFDCSLHDCRHGHTSTARIQTSVVPSDLWYSLTGASSLSLLHEHTLLPL